MTQVWNWNGFNRSSCVTYPYFYCLSKFCKSCREVYSIELTTTINLSYTDYLMAKWKSIFIWNCQGFIQLNFGYICLNILSSSWMSVTASVQILFFKKYLLEFFFTCSLWFFAWLKEGYRNKISGSCQQSNLLI